MKDVQCYELFGGIALKNHAVFISCKKFDLHIGAPMVAVEQLYFLTWILTRVPDTLWLDVKLLTVFVISASDGSAKMIG